MCSREILATSQNHGSTLTIEDLRGSWANPSKKDWVLFSFRNLGLSSPSTEIHNKCSRAVLILDSYLMVKQMNTLVQKFVGNNLQQVTTSPSSRSNIPLEPEHGTCPDTSSTAAPQCVRSCSRSCQSCSEENSASCWCSKFVSEQRLADTKEMTPRRTCLGSKME